MNIYIGSYHMRVPYKKTTVNDVAHRAGVAQSTVSHYINGRVNICSPETGKRIKRAIDELHFAPARAARHLGRKATNTIGICVSLPSEDALISANSYLHRFWTGLSSVVDQESYFITHYPKAIRNGHDCNPFLSGGIDGLIISPFKEDRRLNVLASAGLPVVSVTRSANLPEGVGAVIPNEQDAVDLAVSHLWELGHRRIAFFGAATGLRDGKNIGDGSPHIGESAAKRYSQWRMRLETFGIDVEDLAVLFSSYDYAPLDDALLAVDHWRGLPDPPTAVVCASDRLALSVADAFKARGVRIPDDISLIGIDNEGAAALYEPAITSVEIPVFDIAHAAVRMLIDMVTGEGKARILEMPVTQIVVRSSTCAPHGRANHG